MYLLTRLGVCLYSAIIAVKVQYCRFPGQTQATFDDLPHDTLRIADKIFVPVKYR